MIVSKTIEIRRRWERVRGEFFAIDDYPVKYETPWNEKIDYGGLMKISAKNAPH